MKSSAALTALGAWSALSGISSAQTTGDASCQNCGPCNILLTLPDGVVMQSTGACETTLNSLKLSIYCGANAGLFFKAPGDESGPPSRMVS